LKKYALLSVSDKTNLIPFAEELEKNNYILIATGGTYNLLKSSGLNVTEINKLTGFPEIFNGRVKTLHPKIFGGILFRRNEDIDCIQAVDNGIETIDIVCVNLYPFQEYAEKENSTLDELIENIDIGGPSLIRAAAKNYKYVSVITNPEQYSRFITQLNSGLIDESYRKELALEAFSYTSFYDTLIANTLENKFRLNTDTFRVAVKKKTPLRYGENPHQKAEVYGSFFEHFTFMHGKELSYNNILDTVAAVEMVEELKDNSVVIIKHNNPSGVASSSSLLEAYLNALACDPVSAFGGIVAFNGIVEHELAKKLNEIFLEVLIAPEYSEEALELLKKKKDRRILKQSKSFKEINYQFKSIPGGILKQNIDRINNDFDNLKIVSEIKPNENQLEDLKFAWIVAKNAKSNTIVFAKNQRTLGIGAGQVSRIDAAKIAVMKAKEFGINLEDSVIASDAFFPFSDGILEVINNGAKCIIQPGGSVRDFEVIETVNKNKVSMVFTGIRHFKH
jgi:phosphoribosylaminoimidazolecarboxamide formyltransferase/IMP cyclohydrolase